MTLALLVPSAHAGLITSLIGDQSFAPLVLDMDIPRNAININGMLHVTGGFNNSAARQVIDLSTGIAGPVEQFYSLNGTKGGSGINESVQLNDGRVLFLGLSSLGANGSVATYWFDDITTPISASSFPGDQSSLEGASASGTLIGFDEGIVGGNSGVGQIGSTLQLLAGGSVLAVDITRDANFVVGTGNIWKLGQFGYEDFSTAGFETPANGDVPAGWRGVAIDPVTAQAVFAGEFFNLSTFQTSTGFWNEDGTLLGSFDGQFQDFEIWEGQLVAGLNGYDDDGWVLAISDFSSMSIFDITGSKATLGENSLFVGSAGFVLNGPNGSFVTTYKTSAVPEPSSFLLMLLGSLGMWSTVFRFRANTLLRPLLTSPLMKSL